jgi:hypothetical protein
MKAQKGDEIFDFHSFFDIRRTKDGRIVSSLGLPHFTRKEIPWYSFMLDVAWTPGLLNTFREKKALENFQGT